MDKRRCYKSVAIVVVFVTLMLACSTGNSDKPHKTQGRFSDSLVFWYDVPDSDYVGPVQKPRLVSSVTYFYSDSMCNEFDHTNFGLEEPGFGRKGDTLFWYLPHWLEQGQYRFAKMRLDGDTIYLGFAGEARIDTRRLPAATRVGTHYVQTLFKIRVDTTRSYSVRCCD